MTDSERVIGELTKTLVRTNILAAAVRKDEKN